MKRTILAATVAALFVFPGVSVPETGRFTVNGDGTVTDNTTALVWQRCSAGLSGADCSEGTVEKMNWEDALSYCDDLILPPGGASSWRLPNIKELSSILDMTRYDPAIDTSAFPGTKSGSYLSSSTAAWFNGNTWTVIFTGDGLVSADELKTYTYNVLCVCYISGTQGNITGTVTDCDTGDPLDGVTVHVVSGPSMPDDTTTAGGGAYDFTHLATGVYSVNFTGLVGYLSKTGQEATVTAGNTTTLDVCLEPDGGDVVVLAENLKSPDLLRIDGSYLYFVGATTGAAMSAVMKMSIDGGDVQILAEGLTAPEHNNIIRLVVDGTTLYGQVGGSAGCKIFSLPATGGDVTDLITISSGGNLFGIIGSHLYYSTGFFNLARMPAQGGTGTVILQNNWIRSRALDQEHIYFTEYNSKDVKKFNVTSFALETLMDHTYEWQVLIDDVNLYSISNKEGSHSQGVGQIDKVAKTGGAVTTLLDNGDVEIGFFSDGTNLYYRAGNSIRSIPVAGGTETIFVETAAKPIWATDDDQWVYWIERDENNIGSILKKRK